MRSFAAERSSVGAPALDEERGRAAKPRALGGEPLAMPLDRAVRAASSPARARSSEARSSREVGNDEPCGRRRGRGADVRGEVAERRVLLVSDGADDGHRATRHCADDALVAERQQILEAAAAAREDDDVDLRLGADRGERLGDGHRRARALDERLGDEQPGRREPRLDGGDDVALGGGVVAGHEPDPARDARQRPLPLRREQPLGGELLLQPLERREVLAEPEALDRERPQPQLAARLEQLRPTVDVHPLAVAEVEPQPVELPARHQRREDRPVARVLEREEDALPALLAPQLADLALDPDRRQPLQPRADAAVERRDREDPPVAVLDRLDLHRGNRRGRV